MKRILFTAAAIAAIASPALAEPTSDAMNASLTVNGNVEARCEFQGAEDFSETITVPSALLNTNDGQLPAFLESQFAASFSNVTMWCNGAGTDVSLAATPFGNTQANVNNANFTDRVDYALSVGLSSLGSLNVNTTGAAKGASATQGYNNVGPFIGSPSVALDVVDSNKILVAGAYSASVALTVTPGI